MLLNRDCWQEEGRNTPLSRPQWLNLTHRSFFVFFLDSQWITTTNEKKRKTTNYFGVDSNVSASLFSFTKTCWRSLCEYATTNTNHIMLEKTLTLFVKQDTDSDINFYFAKEWSNPIPKQKPQLPPSRYEKFGKKLSTTFGFRLISQNTSTRPKGTKTGTIAEWMRIRPARIHSSAVEVVHLIQDLQHEYLHWIYD